MRYTYIFIYSMRMSDVCACTCNIICIDKHHWTQISISTQKKYDIKTYKHILYHTIHTSNWSVLHQNVRIQLTVHGGCFAGKMHDHCTQSS